MSNAPQQIKEYYVKVAKSKKKYHALKFHNSNNVEFSNSAEKIEMTREPNQFYQRYDWDTAPKAGEGSEYGRENRDLARKKKLGYNTKGANVENLPWIASFKSNEKNADGSVKEKLYRGKKAVSDNSCYYVFIHNADGGFEAYPLDSWYTFAPHQTYKTLDIDEAEEEFSKRHTILNKYAIMANKRKNENNDETGDGEEGEKKSTKGRGGVAAASNKKGLNDFDAWSNIVGKSKSSKNNEENLSDDDSDGEKRTQDNDDNEGGNKSKKSKKKNEPKKKKRKNDGGEDDDEHMQLNEESDDGDQEGMEKDYSDTESEESELEREEDKSKVEDKYEEKGIDMEEAIRAFDEEDDNSDVDENEEEKKSNEKDKQKKDPFRDPFNDDELSKDSITNKKTSEHDDLGDSSSSSDLEDPDNDPTIVSKLLSDPKRDPLATIAAASSSGKRKATDEATGKASKRSNTSTADSKAILSKVKDDIFNKDKKQTSTDTKPSTSVATSSSLLNEDEVRRHLGRKPLSAKEIIQKIKKKNSNMPKEKLVENVSEILKKLMELKVLKIDEKSGTKYYYL